MLTCVPCHFKHIINMPAEWYVWPLLKNADGSDYTGGVPYTYMCTPCVMEALEKGMEVPNVATERRPDDTLVHVQQVTRIRQQWPAPAQPSNVIKVDFDKGELD